MKKYVNKGLLYEWFNASKVAILIGLITWGFFAHGILQSNIREVKFNISSAESSGFYITRLEDYFILGVIFLAIYFFANGISKRNTTMFLCSGPYTKKQIKINELICLVITLILFIIMYLYIAVTISIKYSELIFIMQGFSQVIFIEVIRLLLFGILGILIMLTIDLLFSNSIMAYLGMIALAISTIGILEKLVMILNYFFNFGRMMDNKVFGRNESDGVSHVNLLFSEGSYNNNEVWLIFKGVIFLVIIIGITLFVFNIFERRSKLETSGKIFTSKSNENIIIIYLSLGIATIINIIFTERTINKMIYKTNQYQSLTGSELVKILPIDIISITVAAFILYKIFKKILKTIG